MYIKPVFIKETDGTYKVNIDADLANDLIMIIESLLDLIRQIKQHAEIKKSFETANDHELRLKRISEFENKAMTVYKRYKQLTKHEFKENKRAALLQIKEEYGFKLSIDAEIHVAEGRKAFREKEKEGKQINIFQ